MTTNAPRPPLPPFSYDDAVTKVRMAENAWNSRDAAKVAIRLIKEIWAHDGNRIAVRFCYEYRDAEGQWFRAHGNENWEFDEGGYMAVRHASINDVPISENDRLFHWPVPGARPDDHPGLSALGL